MVDDERGLEARVRLLGLLDFAVEAFSDGLCDGSAVYLGGSHGCSGGRLSGEGRLV